MEKQIELDENGYRKITLKGLDNGDLNDPRYSMHRISVSENGKIRGTANAKSGHLSTIGKKGGKAQETLTMDQATEIRNLYASGKFSNRQLAEMYGFKGGNPISEILLNNTYYDPEYKPMGGFKTKKNAKVIAVLNELDSIFTTLDMANAILSIGMRDSFKLAMKEARRIVLLTDYVEKLPHEGANNQFNRQLYKKL